MEGVWSVCLAAENELTTHIFDGEKSDDKRLNLDDVEVKKAIENCKKRFMTKVYLNGACDGCPAKCRLNLDAVGN